MAFEQQNYSTNFYYPNPEIYVDEAAQFAVIATPWGDRASAKKTIQIISDYFQSASLDMDATSPFPRLPYLSPAANNMRIAALLANTSLCREENKDEYNSAVEVLILSIHDHELTWLQVGNPSLLIKRADQGLLPVGLQFDLSVECSRQKNLLPPLAANLMGLELNMSMKIQSLRLQKEDELILISRSLVSNSIYTIDQKKLNLQNLVKVFSQTDPSIPFWLAHWKLSY